MHDDSHLPDEIRACRICAQQFRATATAHEPNPVVWIAPRAPVLIACQAPGIRVHRSMKPFDDRSGQRLREWMGVSDEEFYDRDRVAILPMAFCFPGYDSKGSDLPPPPVCARTWHARAMAYIGPPKLRLLVGGHAHRYHLGTRGGVTATVRAWREHLPDTFPLPHPSWRNNAWLNANPWFAEELLPELRHAIRAVI